MLMFFSASCRPEGRSKSLRRSVHGLMLAAGVAKLAACSNGQDASQIGTQKWGTYDVAVEVRPTPPRRGHDEVVVIISGDHHRPVYDAIVDVRADPEQTWVQAIEDGHVGVYRRAVFFRQGPVASLQVRLQRAGTQSVLEFPVTLAP